MSTLASSLAVRRLTTACAGAELWDLASEHAGAGLGPDALALLAKPTIFGTVSDSRAGDPVAIALVMLEEGCINESVAAAEAAVAALQRREPRARSVLERLAAGETRHAALAWRTLRWLLESHPEVAPAPAVARLRVVVTSGPALA